LPVSFTKFDDQFYLEAPATMKSQRVCLLLVIVLSTATLSRVQNWQNFSHKHINPDMQREDCDTIIKERAISGPDNECKPTNTFIRADHRKVQAVRMVGSLTKVITKIT